MNAPAARDTFLTTSAKALAGGYAVLTALLAAVATLHGGLNRLLLNRPWWSLLAVVLILLGVVLGFVAGYAGRRSRDTALLLIGGLLVFVGGVFLFGWLEQDSLLENERPTITVKSSLGTEAATLDATVTANGVKATEWVYAVVTGVIRAADEDGEQATTLYQTRAGPDATGKVTLPFSVGILSHYDYVRIGATRASSRDDEAVDACFAQDQGDMDQSCATVYPSAGPRRPTLSISWDQGSATTRANVLNVDVSTSRVDPSSIVMLDIIAGGATRAILHRAVFSGSSSGSAASSAKVSVPTSTKIVCVFARTTTARDFAPQAQTATRRCTRDALTVDDGSVLLTTAPPTPASDGH